MSLSKLSIRVALWLVCGMFFAVAAQAQFRAWRRRDGDG